MATRTPRVQMTQTQPISVLLPQQRRRQPSAIPERAEKTTMKMARDMKEARDMSQGGEMPNGPDMPTAKDAPAPHEMKSGGLLGGPREANSVLGRKTDTLITSGAGTGSGVLALALEHIGERYILGARAPMANPNWKGPWDCAEFVSWCVYQHSGILFGTQPKNDPMMADAYTGYWGAQAQQAECMIPWQEAVAIPGAILLRKPSSTLTGHIVIVDGKGGTVEAHSTGRGVIAGQVAARRWDVGILVPGIAYYQSDIAPQPLAPPPFVLRVSHPLMRGDLVRKVQGKLAHDGYPIGVVDGIYGPQTAHAVVLFQNASGLLADGEVGQATMGKLFPSAG